MKARLLRHALVAIVATVAISGFGDDKVDYAQMELLVTNRLVCVRHSEMVPYYRDFIKKQTGATDSDIADCLLRYVRRQVNVQTCTEPYDNFSRALGQFTKLADDGQMAVLPEIVENSSGKAACDVLYQYYRRMRKKGGVESVERLLDKKSLSTNAYNEISMVVRMDAAGAFGEDSVHRGKLLAFAKKQFGRRKHLKLADEVMLKLDAGYADSKERRLLLEEILADRIKDMPKGQKEHFRAIMQSVDRRSGGLK